VQEAFHIKLLLVLLLVLPEIRLSQVSRSGESRPERQVSGAQTPSWSAGRIKHIKNMPACTPGVSWLETHQTL